MFVCERERARARERERVCVCEGGRERERESVCVCVFICVEGFNEQMGIPRVLFLVSVASERGVV
jgi:hypothetical protein